MRFFTLVRLVCSNTTLSQVTPPCFHLSFRAGTNRPPLHAHRPPSLPPPRSTVNGFVKLPCWSGPPPSILSGFRQPYFPEGRILCLFPPLSLLRAVSPYFLEDALRSPEKEFPFCSTPIEIKHSLLPSPLLLDIFPCFDLTFHASFAIPAGGAFP